MFILLIVGQTSPCTSSLRGHSSPLAPHQGLRQIELSSDLPGPLVSQVTSLREYRNVQACGRLHPHCFLEAKYVLMNVFPSWTGCSSVESPSGTETRCGTRSRQCLIPSPLGYSDMMLRPRAIMLFSSRAPAPTIMNYMNSRISITIGR